MPQKQTTINYEEGSDGVFRPETDDDGQPKMGAPEGAATQGGGAAPGEEQLFPGARVVGEQLAGAATWEDFVIGGVGTLTEGQRGWLFVQAAEVAGYDAGRLEEAYRANPEAINNFFDQVDLRRLLRQINAPQKAVQMAGSAHPATMVGTAAAAGIFGYAAGSGALGALFSTGGDDDE